MDLPPHNRPHSLGITQHKLNLSHITKADSSQRRDLGTKSTFLLRLPDTKHPSIGLEMGHGNLQKY